MTPIKSPISGQTMERVTLEEGLTAFRCTQSGGHYIPATAYWNWLKRQPERLPHFPDGGDALDLSQDTATPLFCPETGTLMTRFRVGHGFPFSINRSITGGLWLDGGEWEALRQRNFHDELHLIFTAPWQRAVRGSEARAVYEQRLKETLGESLLAQLTELRDALEDHPHHSLAIAYLTENDRSRI
ncbi:hypothetical protein FEM03_00535 [Phragmitibacter flavus]|uniref:Uncharacterized protein n=1 Tax=Phragmitibacter flavus TaxID=2576071 RepID=A0A5R8KK14_9BACT|nr:hypothetical protein [Phragmitibacter flavus]TLD72597.1 hypothetical protein FEM03_00535 [Phragmitibacter flavus]